jgi:hypothetical protein
MPSLTGTSTGQGTGSTGTRTTPAASAAGAGLARRRKRQLYNQYGKIPGYTGGQAPTLTPQQKHVIAQVYSRFGNQQHALAAWARRQYRQKALGIQNISHASPGQVKTARAHHALGYSPVAPGAPNSPDMQVRGLPPDAAVAADVPVTGLPPDPPARQSAPDVPVAGLPADAPFRTPHATPGKPVIPPNPLAGLAPGLRDYLRQRGYNI